LERNDFREDARKLSDQTRENADGLPPLPPTAPKRFKTVSNLVIAMNRFKGDSPASLCAHTLLCSLQKVCNAIATFNCLDMRGSSLLAKC
jgi:hypothetical protein